MRRLDGFSAFMVYNDVPRCYQHTLKIGITDWSEVAGGYDYRTVYKQLQSWIDSNPMLRWKLKRVPFGINHPVWIQDLDFNTSYHVRRIACPAPGNKETFNELVSQLYAQSLDKSKPLWMAWIIEGLEKDRVALVCLFHHAYADGAGAGMLFQRLMSPDSVKPEAETSLALGVNPAKNPSRLRVFFKGLIQLPWMFIKELPPLVATAFRQQRLMSQYKGKGALLPPSPKDAPDSPLNTVYSHGRTFAFESMDLAMASKISKQHNVTINELLLAVVSGAVRRHYQSRELDADQPLVGNIPINIRTEAQKNLIVGNYVSNAFMSIPIHLDDPMARLRYVVDSSSAMKKLLKAVGGEGLLRAVELVPPIAIDIMNWALKRAKGQLKILGNIVISNVRGPTKPMYLGPAKVTNWLSIGQVVAGIGLNITAWSYIGRFNICVMADAKVIPDGAKFTRYLQESFMDYVRLMDEPLVQQTNYPQEDL